MWITLCQPRLVTILSPTSNRSATRATSTRPSARQCLGTRTARTRSPATSVVRPTTGLASAHSHRFAPATMRGHGHSGGERPCRRELLRGPPANSTLNSVRSSSSSPAGSWPAARLTSRRLTPSTPSDSPGSGGGRSSRDSGGWSRSHQPELRLLLDNERAHHFATGTATRCADRGR